MIHEKNEFINNTKNTDDKFIYVRSGKCDSSKCQSACFRFNVNGYYKNSGHKKKYHQMSDYQYIQGIQVRVINRHLINLTPRLCPHIKIEGGCDLHNKRTQPRVCKYFPMSPDDGVYVAVKHVCGYKFKRVKNKNYKKKKKELVDKSTH